MGLERVMVDSATGASPPRSLMNDMACSPIRFRSSIQSTSTSERGFYSSSNFLNQEDKSTRENIVMRKILDNEQSSLSLPSSCSSSSNTTPILSSLSTTRPVSLMSLEINDGYDIRAAQKSSTTSTTRYWPVNRKFRYRNDNPYRQRVRPARGGGVKQRGGDYSPRSAQIRLGDCNCNRLCTTRSCGQCCASYHHC